MASVQSTLEATGTMASSLGGDFIVWSSRGTCTRESQGPCVVSTCAAQPIPAGYLSAGTLTFSSDAMTADVRQLVNGTYDSVYFKGELWSHAGATVTVTAPGGDVPAFTHQLPAPALLSISSATSFAFATATRGNDIAVGWSDDGPCLATFNFTARQGASTYDASCTFPSSDHGGTIPAAALEPFPAGLKATYTFDCRVTDDLVLGDWEIEVRALTQARTGDGHLAAASLSSW